MTREVKEIDWSDDSGSGSNLQNDYMKLAEGSNKVRVLTNPTQFYVHFVVDTTGAKRRVNCALEGCPVCKRGRDDEKAQSKYLIKVLDRRDGAVKLLEIGQQVRKGIKELATDDDWGKPVSAYDINIKRAAKGTNPLYTVLGISKTPLSPKDVALVDEFDKRVVIAKLVVTPTSQQICEKLGWSDTGSDGGSSKVSDDFEGFPARTAGKKKMDVELNFDE